MEHTHSDGSAHSAQATGSHDSDGHHESHHELGFWRKYVFSIDHKVIGIQYGITALVFLFVGFSMMMLMRWNLAYPGKAIPILKDLWPHFGAAVDWIRIHLTGASASTFAQETLPDGTLDPTFYNQLGAMHGTIMVFLGVVPLAVGAFGNYVMPLQIGAPDMAFPKINMASYWAFLPGGILMLISFVLPGGAAQSGWTSYPPLAVINPGQTTWLVAMIFLITSSLLGSINFIVTIIQLRAPGLTFFEPGKRWYGFPVPSQSLPFFVWAQFVTSFLLLLAFPPLEAAGVLQLMDRVAGTSFFMPSGLVVSGKVLDYAGGGSVLLWQHLFWFLAHPEVYVLLLPAMGIVAEVVANNTRKPLFGYKAMVGATLFLGFMSFIVWAHHMFMTSMGTVINAFFQTTTMIISIPSVIILTSLIISLWGGSIRFNTAMLFALAWMPMFGIGGLTGLPLGLSATDIPLHDTLYVIGHFHYVVAPGTIFALFAGIYYWFPKVTGRMMSEKLGKLHFWPSLICMNGIFFPMLLQGMAGMNRRLADGGAEYAHVEHVLWMNELMSWSAWMLAVAQIPFIINFVRSIWWGEKCSENPWNATTIEWMAPSPPGHGNFLSRPIAYRGPYEYSVPGMESDFLPQFVEAKLAATCGAAGQAAPQVAAPGAGKS